MSDKKHIDRIFQESFKDFEATPKSAVWNNIEKQLVNKTPNVIPTRWRYAGIAATMLLLLTAGFHFFNNDEPQTDKVVDTENIAVTPIKNETNTNKANESILKNDKSSNNTLNSNQSNTVIANTNSDAIKTEAEPNSNSFKNDVSDKILVSEETKITKTVNHQDGTTKNNGANSKVKTKNETIVVAYKDENEKAPTANKSQGVLINKNKAQAILNDTSKNNGIAQNEVSAQENTDKHSVNNQKEDNPLTNEVNRLIDENEAKILLNSPKNNGIAQNDILEKGEEKTNDSINNQQDQLLALENAIDNVEENIEAEEKPNRWRVAPNAAPVYFNTLGEGSSIDPQFDNNSKTGELNMSFGITASYAVTKKLRIRSGVNRVNLGYNTNDVIVYQSTGVASSLQNVNGK